jgi:hypothetical protein
MIKKLSSLIAIISLGACQHHAQPLPAVLSDGSEETLNLLKSEMAAALDRSRVQFGGRRPHAIIGVRHCSTPLGPNETRSTAVPERYRLEIQGQTCFAVHEKSDARIELQNTPCRAL